MNYTELLAKRRSIRDYEDQEVPKEVLQEILQDTCMAPSASNGQPWHFIIVQDKALIQRLSDESKKNLLAMIAEDPQSSLSKYKNFLRMRENVFYNAPCLVFIVGENKHHYFHQDCTLAAAYFMFAATARGLGTCWIGLGEHIQDPELKQAIALPENYTIAAAITLGYPKNIPPMVKRKPPIIL